MLAATPPQRGFTLVEVLITLLIVLIGLVGVSATMMDGMQNSRNALYRSQATAVAQELLDRVRGNPAGLANGAYDDISFTTGSSAPDAEQCANTLCGAAALARYDRYAWAANFVAAHPNFQPSLPQGSGTASRVDDAAGACGGLTRYEVSVGWFDVNAGNGQSVEMTICVSA